MPSVDGHVIMYMPDRGTLFGVPGEHHLGYKGNSIWGTGGQCLGYSGTICFGTPGHLVWTQNIRLQDSQRALRSGTKTKRLDKLSPTTYFNINFMNNIPFNLL